MQLHIYVFWSQQLRLRADSCWESHSLCHLYPQQDLCQQATPSIESGWLARKTTCHIGTCHHMPHLHATRIYFKIDVNLYSKIQHQNIKRTLLQFDFFFFGNRLHSRVSIVNQVKWKMQLMVKAHPEGEGNKGQWNRDEKEKEPKRTVWTASHCSSNAHGAPSYCFYFLLTLYSALSTWLIWVR